MAWTRCKSLTRRTVRRRTRRYVQPSNSWQPTRRSSSSTRSNRTLRETFIIAVNGSTQIQNVGRLLAPVCHVRRRCALRAMLTCTIPMTCIYQRHAQRQEWGFGEHKHPEPEMVCEKCTPCHVHQASSRRSKSPLATENLLENTDGIRLMLTCAASPIFNPDRPICGTMKDPVCHAYGFQTQCGKYTITSRESAM